MEELLLGAQGWVAGLVCAFPAETVAIYKLVKAGKIEEAVVIYRWFMPLLELDIHAKLVQYIKLAEARAGIGTEYVRAPRLTLIGKEREYILSIINGALAARPTLPEYLSLEEKAFAVKCFFGLPARFSWHHRCVATLRQHIIVRLRLQF